MVSALYVDVENGPYPKLLGAQACWGVERDAKGYRGPGPVIAHPPCGPWGQLARWCVHQDPTCGPIAVEQVRRFGGVLEHPIATRLRAVCGLPSPFRSLPLVAPREWSLSVEQVRWGHPTRKRTLLFFVGVQPRDLGPIPPSREPTHYLGGEREYRRRMAQLGRKKLGGGGSYAARITPVNFARWLIEGVRRYAERIA